jgi:hypothetical protein
LPIFEIPLVTIKSLFHLLNVNLKTLSFTTLTLAAAMMPADAYFRAGFKVEKSYRQIASDTPSFRSGEAHMYVVDGVITVTGCGLNGSLVPFGIVTTLGCNIGSNSVILEGLGEPPRFYELVGVETATVVEPGRPDLVSLYARPSYDFPAQDLNTQSQTISVFYDTKSQTGDIREYRLAGSGLARNQFIPGYEFKRSYGPSERTRMEREIVPGSYQFKFPSLGRPLTSLYLNLPVLAMIEGYSEKGIKQGFRFVNIRSWDTEGWAEFDVNLTSEFRWEGINPSNVSNTDRAYIGFRRPDLGGAPTNDPDAIFLEVNGNPIYDFPPAAFDPDDPSIVRYPGSRILIPSPLQQSYNLPPGFFTPGQRTIVQVTIERDPKVGVAAVGYRNFELPVVFVNGFPGAMAAAFPKNTPAEMMAKNADPDGDGVSNWMEWLSGTDPYTSNAPAAFSQLSFVPPSTRRSGKTVPGYWQMSIDRRAGLPSAVSVVVESSTNLTDWSPVANDDPHWIVEDIREEPRIRILSRTPELTDKRYFRVKYNDPG